MKLFRAFIVITLATTIFVSSGIAAENTDSQSIEISVIFNEDTPATAVEQFFYSFIKSDVAMLKKRLTKDSLKMMEDGAEKMNMTLDESIKAYMDTKPFNIKRTPQMQKQKLDGDTCTIEVELEGKWEVFNLVKQDEIWRVDLMAIGS